MSSNEPTISAARIKKGLVLFVGFSLVGVLFVLYQSSLQATLTNLRNFDPRFLLLAVALFFFDWLISGSRIYIFARKVHPEITFGACIRSCLANIFLGGITPSQTGGAAAQIYVLYREGLTLVDSTVVCFLGGFLGTAIVLMLSAIIFSVIARPDFVGAPFQVVSNVSLVLFSLVMVVVLISLASPRLFKAGVHGLLNRLPRLRRALDRRGAVEKLFEIVDRYHHLMTGFLIRSKIVFAGGVILSSLIYFNKFLIAYVVLRGLGLQPDFWDVMYMQVVLILIFYFSPTPGAAGLAEVSTAAIMSTVIPAGYEGTFILLWRFFTLVAGMFVGAVVTMRYLYRQA